MQRGKSSTSVKASLKIPLGGTLDAKFCNWNTKPPLLLEGVKDHFNNAAYAHMTHSKTHASNERDVAAYKGEAQHPFKRLDCTKSTMGEITQDASSRLTFDKGQGHAPSGISSPSQTSASSKAERPKQTRSQILVVLRDLASFDLC
ncbi:uncharacterized protein Z518_01300 [Rhinocladiella mackenziei CBS 650.93]|uniref:Uncharacterized protein n=1 Tax=Rhinocladiella mackenziei CBS 650.93 TaxID=1442369 RepID=A0A0D2IVZ9_9EURO|nr:uncharacterized protein Z518_01300 [Rhinocladiella mackenziei CBS 650.93]KIX10219.1 hypothetical protein Z518_01300 [Rhinocladiella mackenziei CBS 650.93]